MNTELKISKGERTKQRVIEQAAHVFNEKGYAGTSVSDLTKATKLTSGAIYGSFEGKNDLAAQAFEYSADKLLEGYLGCVKKEKDPEKQLYRVLEFPSKEIYLMFDGGCPALNMAVEADDTLPWMRTRVNQTFSRLLGLIEDILKRGIEEGRFIPVDTKKYSLYLLSTLEGSIMLAKSFQDLSIMKDAADQMKKEIKAGIVKA